MGKLSSRKSLLYIFFAIVLSFIIVIFFIHSDVFHSQVPNQSAIKENDIKITNNFVSNPSNTKLLESPTIPTSPPTPQPTVLIPKLQLVSLNKPATADVRGNLGHASVVTNELMDDWLKDRWQAAMNMFGEPIPGPHWIEIDLEDKYWIRKILLDWETAYSDEWVIEVKAEREDSWLKVCGGEDAKVTLIDKQHRLHEVFFQPSHDIEDPAHALDPMLTYGKILAPLERPFRFVRLLILRPSTHWGSSLWRLQLWGYLH